MTLGEHFKSCRQHLHLTQQEVADLIGVTQATIGKLEVGAVGPSLEVLLKLFQIRQMKQAFDNFVSENVKTRRMTSIWLEEEKE